MKTRRKFSDADSEGNLEGFVSYSSDQESYYRTDTLKLSPSVFQKIEKYWEDEEEKNNSKKKKK